MLTSTDPKNQTVALAYDEIARTVTLTDGNGNQTVFTSDLRGQRTRKTYADGTHEDWSYDDVAQMLSYTTVAGQTATLARDLRDRPTLLDWSDATPDVTAGYDTRGRITNLGARGQSLLLTLPGVVEKRSRRGHGVKAYY